MDLKPEHIQDRRVVGKTKDNEDVYQLSTHGGLVLIAKLGKSKGVEILGAGGHRAISRHIAGKKMDIDWNELTKSEQWDLSSYQDLLPTYEALTDALNKVCGGK